MKALFDCRGIQPGEVRLFYGDKTEPPPTAKTATTSRQDASQRAEGARVVHLTRSRARVTDNSRQLTLKGVGNGQTGK